MCKLVCEIMAELFSFTVTLELASTWRLKKIFILQFSVHFSLAAYNGL